MMDVANVFLNVNKNVQFVFLDYVNNVYLDIH